MKQDKDAGCLRFGVIGLGIGRQHIKGIQKCSGADVAAICDIDENRLESVGDEYKINERYMDYHVMLERDDIDALCVCTPNHLHAEMAFDALSCGKHVLVEKPMTTNVPDAEQMVNVAHSAKRILQVVFNHRHRGDVQALKTAIDQGHLGRIYHTKAWWLRRNGIPGMGSWFTQKDMSGGGPLIDLGVHMLDIALYLMGEPKVLTVSAAAYSELGQKGIGGNPRTLKTIVGSTYQVEDLASAFIRLEEDATMLLETSWASYRANDDEFGITLYGTEGGAEIKVVNYDQDDTLTIYRDMAGIPGDTKLHTIKGEGHYAVVQQFTDRIRDKQWHLHNGRQGLARTRIIDACYRSAIHSSEIRF
jgi:predicted dehydrogenase